LFDIERPWRLANPQLKRQNYAHYNLQAKIAEMLSRLASSLAE
jgi:hypothetical protein